jgi:hypothetical protein
MDGYTSTSTQGEVAERPFLFILALFSSPLKTIEPGLFSKGKRFFMIPDTLPTQIDYLRKRGRLTKTIENKGMIGCCKKRF